MIFPSKYGKKLDLREFSFIYKPSFIVYKQKTIVVSGMYNFSICPLTS